MAGEWIKIDVTLPGKPEVIRIGRALGISPDAVCGVLIRFWGWASANSVDGFVTQVALRDVDMIITLPGFAEAMTTVGWLLYDDQKQRLVLPNFTRHNGESAKKRALTSKRQEKYRNAHVDASVTQQASLEKRREEYTEAKASVRAKGSRMPAGWTLPQPWEAWAMAEQPTWTTQHTGKMAATFRDYWIAKPGQSGVKTDWEATWRNWVRREGPMRINGKPVEAKEWWESSMGIEAKGAQLGETRSEGEPFPYFKARVFEKAGQGPWSNRQ